MFRQLAKVNLTNYNQYRWYGDSKRTLDTFKLNVYKILSLSPIHVVVEEVRHGDLVLTEPSIHNNSSYVIKFDWYISDQRYHRFFKSDKVKLNSRRFSPIPNKLLEPINDRKQIIKMLTSL